MAIWYWLDPALSALILKPRDKMYGGTARYFKGFNTFLNKATHGYVTFSHRLIRKAAICWVAHWYHAVHWLFGSPERYRG